MFRDQAHELCARVAEETLARIGSDSRRVKTVWVSRLLKEIEKDLLNPDISVEQLRLRCGSRDKNLSTTFARELGLGPRDYIIQARMETACRALASTRFDVWRIGVNLGYLTPNSFSRAFKKWCGRTPEELRAEEAAGAGGAPGPVGVLSGKEIERALAGALPAAEAEELVGRLDEIRDRIRAGYQALPTSSERLLSERMMAAYLWRCVEHQPHEIQRAAVESHAAAFHTPALFLVLSTASVEATDGARATQLANLARASLQTIETRLGDSAPPYQVRALAVTGYALSRAGRLVDAACAFAAAIDPLDKLNDEPHPVVLADLSLFLALFEARRGNVDQALKNLDSHSWLLRSLGELLEDADDREEG